MLRGGMNSGSKLDFVRQLRIPAALPWRSGGHADTPVIFRRPIVIDYHTGSSPYMD